VNSSTDQQLLREFALKRSEAAFSELVRRHVDFVYSAALRMVRDSHRAEDVAQGVFVALAHNAARLTDRVVLSGWLHRTSRNLAANVVRADVRRRQREQEAAAMNELLPAENDAVWEEIAPHLDTALDELTEAERDVILLRFFQKKSAREMAGILGVTDEAAQKRVNRAVDRLRELLVKRGVIVGVTGLAAVISIHAVQAAPVALAGTITTAALLAQTPILATAVAKTLIMTTAQKLTIVAALTVAVGAGIFEARQTAVARREAETLRRGQLPLTEQIQRLQQERDQARNQLAAMKGTVASMKGNSAEVAKLRGQLARLRGNAGDAADPFVQTALTWKEKKARLKQLFQERPDQSIPELRLMGDQTWLNAAMNANLDTEDGIRKAMSDLRMTAENQLMNNLMPAIANYMQTNQGRFPTDLAQLVPYVNSPAADDLVQRYQIVPADQLPNVRLGGDFYITEKAPVDPDMDNQWVIGQSGFSQTRFQTPDEAALAPAEKTLMPVLAAYSAANGGTTPSDLNLLQPYATTPEQQAALQQMLQYKPNRPSK
jgi:RNA polymerase sigma factor (sigma-70 family)